MPSNIHCYIDESGHTGANLFDPVQPIFYTGAVISCFDFDARYPTLLEDISRPHGLPRFHANELGLKKLQPHLSKIQSIIKRENIRFYLASIPIVGLVIALFALYRFPLTPARMAEIRGDLEARRGAI